jgi:DNA-binding NarL/FixJ family response regulator
VATIKVIHAEDHALMRDAVQMVLACCDDIELVAAAGDGDELEALMRAREPHVVLLDVRLPRMDGLACLEFLRERHPRVHVVMLSAVDEEQVIESAFRRGARGYILKTVNPFDLPAAIRQIVEGTVIHPLRPTSESSTSRLPGLSQREVEVLAALGSGDSNREIARRLWLSEQTVKFHLRNVYRKLGVRTRTEALRVAYECDLSGEAGRAR